MELMTDFNNEYQTIILKKYGRGFSELVLNQPEKPLGSSRFSLDIDSLHETHQPSYLPSHRGAQRIDCHAVSAGRSIRTCASLSAHNTRFDSRIRRATRGVCAE